MLRRALPVLIALILAGCGSEAPAPQSAANPTPIPATPAPPTCQDAAMAYDDAMRPILARWDDAVKVASSTARIGLAGVISDMQAIARDAEAVTPAACVAPVHTLLLRAMTSTVDGYLAFAGQKDEVERLLVGGQLDYALALQQVNDLSRGKALAAQAPTPTVSAMVKRFEDAGYTMKGRALGGGKKAWNGEVDGVRVEVVAYADGVLKSVFVGTVDESPARAAGLARAIQIAVPEWSGAEAWITARMDSKQEQSVAVGRTVITLSRLIKTNSLNAVFY